MTFFPDNATENATIPLEECKEVLRIAHKLREAFSHRRVVYLINHDISEEEVYLFSNTEDETFTLGNK